MRHVAAQSVEVLRYKPARSRVPTRWCQWYFSTDKILPVALWPWGSTQPLKEMGLVCLFSVALRHIGGHGLLILEVS